MKPLNQLGIGSSGVEYAKGVLEYENELCTLASQALLCLKKPKAFTFLPEGDVNQSLDFNSGGLQFNMFGQMGEYLYRKNQQSSLIFDDVMASPNDTHSEVNYVRRTSKEDNVYHVASVNEFDSPLDAIGLIGQTSVAWHFLCVILKIQVLPSKLVFENLHPQNVSEVIVGAFDGEGFIVIKS